MIRASLARAACRPDRRCRRRGIAISLPGFGYSDIQPGRQVKDWPRDDLAPVLAREGVDRFMITGHSQGNPHAMAAAWYFGDRCEGLGL